MATNDPPVSPTEQFLVLDRLIGELRACGPGHVFIDMHTLRALQAARAQLAATEKVLENLECSKLRCWCFTRAAMRDRGECGCDNCTLWRTFQRAQDSVPA